MKKKFTMLFALLLCCVGVMKADFRHSWTKAPSPWTSENVEVNDQPEGLAACISKATEGCDQVRKAETQVVATGGDVTVTFTHKDGGHMLAIRGVDLLQNGEVKYSEYHAGKAGGSPQDNVYTLEGVEAGEYTLRYWVCNFAGDHELTNTAGTIDVVGLNLKNQITAIADLKNSSLYIVQQQYHSQGRVTGWAVADGGTAIQSLRDMWIHDNTNSLTDTRQRFAFITNDEGNTYYLYHAAEKKYVNNDGSLSRKPRYPITFKEGTKPNTFVVWFDKWHIINIGGSEQMAVNGWGPDGNNGFADGGNSCAFIEVENKYDMTEALEAFDLVEVTYNYILGNGAKRTIVEYQKEGEAFISHDFDFVTYTPLTGTVPGEDVVKDINCTENLPFVTTTIADGEFSDNTVWYVMMQKTTNNYWKYNSSETPNVKATSTNNSIYDEKQMWCFTGNAFDGVKVYNKAAGASYSLDNGAPAKLVENNSAVWNVRVSDQTFAATDKRFGLARPGKTGNSEYANLQSGDVLKGWSLDAGSTSCVVAVADKQEEIIAAWEKLLAMEEGTVGGLATTDGFQDLVSAYEAAPSQATEDAVNEFIENNDLEVENGKYYQIRSAYDAFYNIQSVLKTLYSDGADLKWATTDNTEKKHYWVAEIVDGQLRFKNAYDNKYMALKSTTTTEGETTKTSTDIVMWDGAASDDASITYNAAIAVNKTNVYTQMNINIASNGNLHANKHVTGTGNNGDIIIYGSGANGASAWRLVEVSDVDAAIAKANLQNRVDDLNEIVASAGVCVGQYDVAEVAKFAEELAVAEALLENGTEGANVYEAALDELNAAVEKASLEVIPMTAGYYFIKGTGTGNNADWYATYENNKDWKGVALTAGEKLGAKHVWKLEECEDGYKFQSSNIGKYAVLGDASSLSSGPSQIAADYTQGSKFVLTNNGGGKFTMKDGNGNVMRTENDGAINYWSGEKNETWYLVPVTELEITISEFASICLPFDVVPGEGVKAYAIEGTNATQAILVEKEDIPAGEGAILEGNGTVKLNLTGAASNWEDNLLEGTTVNTNIDKAAYVLAKPEGKEIGLYSAKLTDGSFLNNANKAYLPASAVSNTGAPMFSFSRGDDETTSIDNVKLINDNVVIYDLLGRRVEKMEKGIYIVNGKKVIR